MATLLSERGAQASWRDYLELTKPKVVLLMLITSLVGMFLATRAGVPWTVRYSATSVLRSVPGARRRSITWLIGVSIR